MIDTKQPREGKTMDLKQGENKKIQFEFSAEALRRLERLEAETEATSKAEVIRRALKIYDWIVSQLDSEDTLTVKDQDGNELFKSQVSMLR